MKRREFVAASCVAGLAAVARESLAQEGATPGSGGGREFYELRIYRIASAEKRQVMEGFLGDAAVPAWNRLGISPVGAFRETAEDKHDLYVILPYGKLETLVGAAAKLMADDEFVRAGEKVLDDAFADPTFQRIESSLLYAFEGMPKLEVPTKAASRVAQLRIYESHNPTKAKKKIEMFNAGGEIDIFRRVGLNPILFGETLIGPKVPNLTYMLGFDNEEAQKKAWDTFVKDPAWLKLKEDAQYKDTVSTITNLVLRPLGCSQI